MANFESNNNPDQTIFDFAVTVSQQKDATAQTVAQWLTEEIGNEKFDKHKVTLIINSPLTLEEKIKYLNTMYLKTVQPNLIQQDTAKVTHNNYIHAAIKTGLTLATMLTVSAIVWPVALVISTKLKPQLIEHYFDYCNQMTSYLLPKLIKK